MTKYYRLKYSHKVQNDTLISDIIYLLQILRHTGLILIRLCVYNLSMCNRLVDLLGGLSKKYVKNWVVKCVWFDKSYSLLKVES